MGFMNGKFILNSSIQDEKLSQIFSPNKVSAAAVEDKFIRNDGDDFSSGKITANGFDASSQRITSVSPGIAASDVVVKSQLDGLATGLSWRLPALSMIADNTLPPPSENLGDRYILSSAGGTPHPDWDGAAAADIVEFDGASWQAETPQVNFAIFTSDTDAAYTFDHNSGMWIQFTGAGQINAGDGLDKIGNTLSVKSVNIAGIGLEGDGSNNLRLASGGFGHGLLGGSGAQVTVDVDQIVGVGVENDGSEAIRLSAQGDGLAGGGGSLVSVMPDVTGGSFLASSINVSPNGIALKVDSVTIQEGASGRLEVRPNSIDHNRISSSGIGNGLTGGNGAQLAAEADVIGGSNLAKSLNVSANGVAIKIDDSSIGENGSGQLEVKSSGIGVSKLNLASSSGLHDAGSDQISVELKSGGGIIYDTGLAVDLGQLSTIDPVVDWITLTVTDISNGYVTLTQTPVNASEVKLTILSGLPQKYSTDYSVDTGLKRLTFLGSLASELESGEDIQVCYSRAT